MEKRIEEKIKFTIEEFNKSVDEFNATTSQFFEELLTDDIKRMVKETCNFNHVSRNDYLYCRDIGSFYITDDGVPEIRVNGDIVSKFCMDRTRTAINDYSIRDLKWDAQKFKQHKKCFEFAKSNAEELIKEVINKYEKTMKQQTSELDNILDDLGVEYTNTKHIKVTVEWI